MNIARWEPFAEFRSLARRMDRMLESIPQLMSTEREPLRGTTLESWPTVDVYEDKEEIVVRAEVPGMEQKDVEVSLEDSTLTVRGNRHLFHEDRKENYVRTESYFGAFSRSFALPPTIDRDKIRADLKSGILEVHVPKREGAKGKSIPIHT